MPDAGKFNEGQVEQILEWLGAGYTDADIERLIAKRRDKGELIRDQPWPEVTRGAIRYYRRKFGELTTEISARSSDVSISTGLATKQALAKRLAARAGRVEMTIETLQEEMDRLIVEGALQGMNFSLPDDPDILEANYSYEDDTVPGNKAPTLSKKNSETKVKLYDDPRYERLRDLMKLIPVWVREYTALMKVLRDLNPVNAKTDEEENDRQRSEAAARAFADIKNFIVNRTREAG